MDIFNNIIKDINSIIFMPLVILSLFKSIGYGIILVLIVNTLFHNSALKSVKIFFLFNIFGISLVLCNLTANFIYNGSFTPNYLDDFVPLFCSLGSSIYLIMSIKKTNFSDIKFILTFFLGSIYSLLIIIILLDFLNNYDDLLYYLSNLSNLNFLINDTSKLILHYCFPSLVVIGLYFYFKKRLSIKLFISTILISFFSFYFITFQNFPIELKYFLLFLLLIITLNYLSYLDNVNKYFKLMIFIVSMILLFASKGIEINSSLYGYRSSMSEWGFPDSIQGLRALIIGILIGLITYLNTIKSIPKIINYFLNAIVGGFLLSGFIEQSFLGVMLYFIVYLKQKFDKNIYLYYMLLSIIYLLANFVAKYYFSDPIVLFSIIASFIIAFLIVIFKKAIIPLFNKYILNKKIT